MVTHANIQCLGLSLTFVVQSGERVARLDDLQDIDELYVVEVRPLHSHCSSGRYLDHRTCAATAGPCPRPAMWQWLLFEPGLLPWQKALCMPSRRELLLQSAQRRLLAAATAATPAPCPASPCMQTRVRLEPARSLLSSCETDCSPCRPSHHYACPGSWRDLSSLCSCTRSQHLRGAR